MINETPNFYAILTPDVRYSKEISANEKLLFAEVTALLTMRNECFASNNYFASLFGVTPQAISKWLKNLEKNGFVSMKYIYKQGSKEIEKRFIEVSTSVDRGINNGIKGINNSLGGINSRLKVSNTLLINTLNNNTIYASLSEKEKELFNEYLDLRKKKKLSNQDSVIKRLLKKYDELKRNPQIIENAIVREYRDFFPINNYGGKNSALLARCTRESEKDYTATEF